MRTKREINSLSRRRKLGRGSGGMLCWGIFLNSKTLNSWVSESFRQVNVQLPSQSSDEALKIGKLVHS